MNNCKSNQIPEPIESSNAHAVALSLDDPWNPIDVLVLFFYKERLKGAASDWSIYLDLLPAAFGTPLAIREQLPLGQLPETAQQLFVQLCKRFDAGFVKVS